ncbi:hypothetical protein KL930_004479 [Ogataea haglerorum]|uniref:Mitogen-activated protein kinase n=1 Tax=Ogataea haglerorum TaxID=1937702 RepID=A0AAN6D2D5_9ASCO|nr:uncharacterized protein KL911_004833 [Ogataea haglerorum]KAG7692537.1 hypothetical protein KL915_004584 [Ogataea haglerorum]KAG7692772.1 hypothetical protein KL951_004783 [Ogataea haglerorum]KAG7703484.1 hypothetical protein KL950_004712 [Ogataea haglerorum]KAG7703951.1 hypothetical protein KL914_004442 [Ogataea haglerorum]KAG7715571.1 hypothetical protein KL913_003906 [Ogataea haglerorum]
MHAKQFVFNLRDYEVRDILGEGAYGVVALGVHRRSGATVAVKKIEPFERELFCLRTLREIKLLKHFKHNNIISILDIQKPRDFESFREVYIVQEYMETDLHHVIRSQTLSDDHVQYLMYQALKGVKCLHSCGVIHRDLKPANLLVNSNCDLKICDFGLARVGRDDSASVSESKDSFLTEYVATRWYRAPEIMLTSSQYSKAIDIWSLACILAEMLLREPFLPGKDYRHQLLLIFEILGTPTGADFQSIKSKRAREYIRSQRFFKKIPLRKIFPHANPSAVDLMEKMLKFDPSQRLTVEEALEHPYFSAYRVAKEETTAVPIPKDFFFFDDCKEQLEMIDLKRMLYAEILAT